MIKRLLCILLIAASLALTACDGGNEPEEPVPTAAPTMAVLTPAHDPVPQAGGTLTLSMRHPLTLNPLLNEDETVDRILALMFEPLFILDEELCPQVNPALLESCVLSADAKTLTVFLKEDAYWSDGQRITNDDVVFSIDYLLRISPQDAVYKSCVANVLSASVSGGGVRINLKDPCPRIAYMLSFPIIPSHYYKGAGVSNAKQMKPLGCGPFVMDAFTPPREMTLTASQNAPGGAPYIENVRVIITDADADDVKAFESGVINAVTVDLTGYNLARGASDMRTAAYPTQYFDFIGFNVNHPLLAVREAREALGRCLPWGQIRDSVYHGFCLMSPTPINPASWLYDEETTHYAYDLTQAELLIREPLDAWTALGEAAALGILVNEENPERLQVAELLAQGLESLGIEAEVISLPWDAFVARLESGKFDVFLAGYNLSPLPDLSFMLHSSSVGGTNLTGYHNEEMDALLTEAFRAADEGAPAAFAELQRYIATEAPVIGICFRQGELLVSKNVYGTLSPASGHEFGGVRDWYMNVK